VEPSSNVIWRRALACSHSAGMRQSIWSAVRPGARAVHMRAGAMTGGGQERQRARETHTSVSRGNWCVLAVALLAEQWHAGPMMGAWRRFNSDLDTRPVTVA
jgi:hypothetical protein